MITWIWWLRLTEPTTTKDTKTINGFFFSIEIGIRKLYTKSSNKKKSVIHYGVREIGDILNTEKLRIENVRIGSQIQIQNKQKKAVIKSWQLELTVWRSFWNVQFKLFRKIVHFTVKLWSVFVWHVHNVPDYLYRAGGTGMKKKHWNDEGKKYQKALISFGHAKIWTHK